MPTIMDIMIGGIALPDVIGKAYLRNSGIKVSDELDGSSLNLVGTAHFVAFSMPRDTPNGLRKILRLNAAIPLSCRYSTGETVHDAPAMIREINPQDGGETEYVLEVGPNEALLEDDGRV